MAEEFDGPVVIHGELRIPGPIRPEPAAQFGSHVGMDGNLDVAGRLSILDTGRLVVAGPVRPEPAAQFGSHVGVEGDLNVAGHIRSEGGDCAEEFEVAADYHGAVSPGAVLVLSAGGSLRPSTAAYDKRVAGVVSGGGDYRPAITLDTRSDGSSRVAIALVGKVACNVDARYGPVEIGDLLTTSDTPGYAMKASDPSRAFGAVIGKALGTLRSGHALLPVLVSLR